VRWHDSGERSLHFKINWSKPGSNTSMEAVTLGNAQERLRCWIYWRADGSRTSKMRRYPLPMRLREKEAEDDRDPMLPRVRR
jgi:hypothetical protein